jgi:hypothetical protein
MMKIPVRFKQLFFNKSEVVQPPVPDRVAVEPENGLRIKEDTETRQFIRPHLFM